MQKRRRLRNFGQDSNRRTQSGERKRKRTRQTQHWSEEIAELDRENSCSYEPSSQLYNVCMHGLRSEFPSSENPCKTMRELIKRIIELKGDALHSPNGEPNFLVACYNGRINAAKIMLKFGANIEEAYNGKTALMYAIENRKYRTVRFLIEAKASPLSSLGILCHRSAQKNKRKDLQIAQYLLEAKADPNGPSADIHASQISSPLYIACARGNMPMVNFLLRNNAKPIAARNIDSLLWNMIRTETIDNDVLKYLFLDCKHQLDDEIGEQLLSMHARNKKLPIQEPLLSARGTSEKFKFLVWWVTVSVHKRHQEQAEKYFRMRAAKSKVNLYTTVMKWLKYLRSFQAEEEPYECKWKESMIGHGLGLIYFMLKTSNPNIIPKDRTEKRDCCFKLEKEVRRTFKSWPLKSYHRRASKMRTRVRKLLDKNFGKGGVGGIVLSYCSNWWTNWKSHLKSEIVTKLTTYLQQQERMLDQFDVCEDFIREAEDYWGSQGLKDCMNHDFLFLDHKAAGNLTPFYPDEVKGKDIIWLGYPGVSQMNAVADFILKEKYRVVYLVVPHIPNSKWLKRLDTPGMGDWYTAVGQRCFNRGNNQPPFWVNRREANSKVLTPFHEEGEKGARALSMFKWSIVKYVQTSESHTLTPAESSSLLNNATGQIKLLMERGVQRYQDSLMSFLREVVASEDK